MFVRLQCAVAHLPANSRRRAELEQRERELLDRHGAEWLGRWSGLGHFARGLVHLACDPKRLRRLVSGPGAEAALPWVEHLHALGLWRDAEALLCRPWARHLASLDLGSGHVGDHGVATLAGARRLMNLVRLNLRSNRIGPAGVAALATAPTFSRVRFCDLGRNAIGPIGTAHLAASAFFENLTFLGFHDNAVGPEGTAALAGSRPSGRLTLLDLSSNGIGDAGAAALAASPCFPGSTSCGSVGTVLDQRGQRPSFIRLTWAR
jgi:hypothetical protein